MADIGSRKVHREIVRDGRTFTADVEITPDGKVEISVTSSDVPGEIISQMSGVVDPDDFGIFGKIFLPEFAELALRESSRSEPSKMERRREQDPNFGGPWSDVSKKQILKMHHSGAAVEVIAAEFGRSVNGIRAQLRKMGVQVAYEQ